MFRLLFLSILVSMSTVIIAQNTFSTFEDSDPEATKILDAIKAEYQKHDAVKLNFKLGIEFPGESMEEQEGSIIQKGENFILDIQGQTIYCDGTIIWVYNEDSNEVQINDADFDEESMFMSPKDIFNLYKSGDYSYAITMKGSENANDVTEIEFKPLKSDSEYSKMRLSLISNDSQVKILKIFSKDGSRYTMKIEELTYSSDLSDSIFNFNVEDYPNITVEDLRL